MKTKKFEFSQKTFSNREAFLLLKAIDDEEEKTGDMLAQIAAIRGRYMQDIAEGMDKIEAVNLAMKSTARFVTDWDLTGFNRLVDLLVLDGYRIEAPIKKGDISTYGKSFEELSEDDEEKLSDDNLIKWPSMRVED